ncbi:MAG: hypothetical protein WC794_03030 [Candidatus Doudnabacteria bacterium]|jgi:hypothetical protein
MPEKTSQYPLGITPEAGLGYELNHPLEVPPRNDGSSESALRTAFSNAESAMAELPESALASSLQALTALVEKLRSKLPGRNK